MTSNIIIPLIISLIAGLASTLGNIFIFIKPKNINSFIGSSLTFSATIMVLISIFELIPEGFFYLYDKYSLFLSIFSLFLILLISYSINILISKKIKKRVEKGSNLYKIGLLSILALMIHNLPEGILTFLSSTVDLELGLKLALAIMLHNIPEGIAIAVPIYYSTYSYKRAVEGTLISGLSEPLGALLAYLFLYKYISNTMISFILIFVAGIMISISINDIYDEIKNYSYKSILIGFISGVVVFIATNILF